MKPLFALLTLIAASCAAHSAVLIGPFDYSTSSQFTSNFYVTSPVSGTFGVTGGQLVNTNTTGSTAVSWVYDTTPDGTPSNASFANFTVSTTYSTQITGTSFGFYFYNGGNRASSLQAMISLSASGLTNFRFWTGSNMTNSAPGTLADSSTPSTGFTINTFIVATLAVQTLSPGNVQATLTLSDPNLILPSFSTSYTFTGVAATQGEIGFRSYTNENATNRFDNLVAYSIPEPSTTLLLTGALTALLIFRRRRA